MLPTIASGQALICEVPGSRSAVVGLVPWPGCPDGLPPARYISSAASQPVQLASDTRLVAGTRNPDPGEMEGLFRGSGLRKNRWLPGLATPDSCDWLKKLFRDWWHRTVALRRQRSRVRIV